MRNTVVRLYLCAFLCTLLSCAVYGQQSNPNTINEHEQCGTQQWLETQFRAYPSLRQQYQQMEQKMGAAVTKKLQQARTTSSGAASLNGIMDETPVFTIPVVFHIVHTSPATITDAQILAQLDTLNKDYSGTNGDSIKILAGFKPLFGKSNIRFCLAQRTPAGAVTNGIVRYTSSTISTGSGTTNDPIKSTAAGGADAWDPTRYVNVWIGTFSVSGLLGYASFPITSPENPAGLLSQQGLVIEKGTIPGGALTNYNNGRTLTHEIGHYFWLRHIWGDSTCGNDFPNTPGIDDTPTVDGPSSGCSSGIVPTNCAGTSPYGRMYQNYMDYSYSVCMAMFSVGQTIRMATCLDSFRTSLKTSNGCQPVNCPVFMIGITSTGTSGIVNVTGGQAPYTYSIDSINYQSGNQLTGLVPGRTYTVYVRDALFCRGRTSFTANGITVSPLAAYSYCAGGATAISFTTASTFATGNIFTAQLSDLSGSFAYPIPIGTVTATGNATINAVLPDTMRPGTHYRIRVVASNPAVTSTDNGYDFEISNASVVPAVTIGVTAGTNPGCLNRPVSFTATAVNGGNAPRFTWFRNGTSVDTGRVFTTATLLNNDTITCSMVSNSACTTTFSALSNAIRLTLAANLTPSVTIAANTPTTICSGTTVVFTAVTVNEGTAPTYQWKKNGVNVGSNAPVYTIASLANRDTITCVLTSGLACASPASVPSNSLIFSVNTTVVPAVLISSSVGASTCPGTLVTFTAIPTNGGVSPSFQWRKNGVAVGTNSTVYTDNTLVNGDSITCTMNRTTPAVCLSATTVTSNTLRMTILNCGSQLVSGNAFLQDNYVEVAVGPCGNFASTVEAPTGFHPRGTGGLSTNRQLGFVSDSAKSGWSNYVGDYFLPGNPEEGFGLTVNNISYNNNRICTVNTIPGSITNVQSGSLQKSATWQGSVGGLTITAKTYIPTGALYFVTKVTVTNTSSAPLSNVFYMRNVDPDQGALTPNSTGSTYTYNSVVYQTPNACNRALATATTRVPAADFLGLGSVDPRARVSIGGFENRIAANIWNGVGVTLSGTNVYGDNAISIAFNLGTLNINESTSFSYAYILNQADLEPALAATGMNVSIAGITTDNEKATDVCSGVAVPIRLTNTGSYTSWSWLPATGLDTAAGTSVNATVTTPTVYKATGTGPCGTVTLTIALNPVTQAAVGNAGPITGPATPAQGAASVVYSIAPVPNAKSYIWTVPAGVIINSVPDSNVISVRIPAFAFCDSISVVPRNGCSTGGRSALAICATSPYAISLGTVTGVCIPATVAYLPYTAVTGNPTTYTITWDAAALAAGFVNVTNAPLPASPIPISKPAGTPTGNYNGRISVGNGTLSSVLYSFVLPVLNTPVLVPQITISASTATSICSGTPVTFTANLVNGGATPILQWRKNNLVVGTGTATYTDNTIANGDSITCTLTSTASCVSPATVTSAALRFTVTTAPIPAISINSPGGNYACVGSTVTFTATLINPGTSRVLQWRKNGVLADTGLTYTTSGLVQNDTIVCSMTSTNICAAAVTVTSNPLVMTITTVTTPTASGAATINCGQTVTLNAAPTTTGNVINWYTAASGGAAFAQGASVSVTPSVTTTYYAEAGSPFGGTGSRVTAISTTGAVFFDHSSITGDDRAGIVVSNNHVYYTGDSYTGKFSKSLTGGVSLPLRDGFFSNLSNGDLWQLGTTTSAGTSFTSGAATRLYKLDTSLVPTGSYLTLSQTINLSGGFVAAGQGFVIIYTGGIFYRISLNDGTVTNLNGASGFSYTTSEGWASYGWAEFDGTNYYICYVASSTAISKRNVVTGVVSILQSFTSLGDMAAIIFDPQTSRMYYHHEDGSQFGGSGETIGYLSVTSSQAIPLCASARVPVTVTVNTPAITPSVAIVSNYNGTVCTGTTVTFTASATNGGLTPAYQWRRNGVNVATGATYVASGLVNNDVITCQLTSSLVCVTTPLANSNGIVVSVITPATYPYVNLSSSATGTVCYGTPVSFTATVINAGSSTIVYQWRKNGINVGSNSAVYVDNATSAGTLTCTITTNLPCTYTTSTTTSISLTTPVQPSVGIVSSAGNTICTGSSVTFTATGVNTGSLPVYQWRKNGVIVAAGVTYTTTALVTGDTITCYMTSNLSCVTQATVASNAIVMTVNALPTINPIAAKSVCPGSTVPGITFSGTGATYRWTNNNTGIGLAANGTGNIPAFVATNTGTTPITATLTVTPVSAGAAYAYVANNASNTVSVISLATNTTVTTIPVGNAPWGVAASPDGSRVYVCNTGSPGTISVINTATNQVTSTITINATSYGLCVSPDGSRLYVSSYNQGYIYVFNTATNAQIYTLYPSYTIYGLAVSPDGTKLYAVGTNVMYVYNTSTYSVIASLTTVTNPIGVAVGGDGSKVYVSNSGSNTVSVINAISNTIITNVAVGNSPYNLVMSQDGKMVYVCNNGSNTVSVINTSTNEIAATIPVGNAPSGISINADGTTVYVTNQISNTVSVINTPSNTVTATLSGFSTPVSWGNFITGKPGCTGAPATFTINVSPPDFNTWIGTVSTDWHTAANWMCGRVPTPADKVLIAVSTNNYYPVILENDSITIRSIKLEPGTSVRVSNSTSFVITGTD